MSLTPGTRLGPYEIERPIGAGGMGEVYKARDTRLDRSVAIKILPEELAGDAGRRARFEREARTVASLSHPHICAIHDVGSEASADARHPIAYLVMEFVEGETLAARLARGPLPLDQVARFGGDIATALDAAHRQRIAHRDLKPANVMITRSGVKLLDFGLAKAMTTAGEPTAVTSLNVTAVTAPGTVLGTLPYMAPEQVEGGTTDWRSDIFALGAVIYEMATARRAFPGESPAAVASAILTAEPPALEESPALDRIVRGCLAKDPDRRWQSAHDVALQLAGLAERERPQILASGARLAWLPWAVAATAMALALVALWTGRRQPAATTAVAAPIAFLVPPPAGGGFALHVETNAIAVSPDGSQLAFSGSSGEGRRSLWLRTFAAVEPRPVPGTEGAVSPFWSPDGKSIAFFTGNRLKRVGLTGDAPVIICPVREGIGHSGTWGADGQILFASVQGEAIMSVPQSGGAPVELLKPDAARQEQRTVWPSFLPDGRSFIYNIGFPVDAGAIMLRRPDGSSQEVLRVKSAAQYVEPGYLVFSQDSTLIARRFDAATGTLSGDPLAIAERVNYFRATGAAHFSASRNGVIAYLSRSDESYIAVFDRSGRELAEVRPRAGYQSLHLAGRGSELVFERVDPRTTNYDLWRLELDRGVETKLTSDPGTEVFGLLDREGNLFYSAARGGPPRLHRRNLTTGADEPLEPTYPGLQMARDLSPDGKWLIYSQRSDYGNYDVHALSLADGRVVQVRNSPADENAERFSPDGRWLTFTSDESGRTEVYIVPFPSPGAPRAISSGGGAVPRWSADGRELLYLSPGGQMMAVPVRTGPSLEIGKAALLFAAPSRRPWRDFDVTPDGRLIAVVALQYAAEQPLTVITDWPGLTKTRQ